MRDCSQQLETELSALTAERDQLRAALALGQEKCDDVYDELRADCDELRADVVRLTARAERAEAELTAERARLDCLRDAVVEIVWDHQGPGVMRGEDGHCFYGGSLRAAIDAAMKEAAQ